MFLCALALRTSPLIAALAHPRNRCTRAPVAFLDGAGAIAHDASAKIHRYYGGYSADNGSSAFQCFIRNVKGEKFYAGLAVAVVAVDRLLKEIGHGYASY